MNKPGPQLLFFVLITLVFAGSFLITPFIVKKVSIDVQEEEILIIEKEEVIPDFSIISDIELKKQTFFNFIQPYIDNENAQILDYRNKLISLKTKLDLIASKPEAAIENIERSNVLVMVLDRDEIIFLADLAEGYAIELNIPFSSADIITILEKIDVLPSALVLSQAANESAWGTSRFAVQGKNYFGQWCYTLGCGLIPARRGLDQEHEVRSFANVADSVHAYFANINTNSSYQKLRKIRANLRNSGEIIDGISLAEGLDKYSERGLEYISELQAMMRFNNLLKRDET